MKKIFIFIFLPALIYAQKSKEIPFSDKEFLNLAYFFNNQQEIIDFFDFKKGDVVADIGAREGLHEGIFSLLFDSIHFYAQDIDTKFLNEKNLNKAIKHYTKIKGSPLTNTFDICIGTEKSTNLPDGIFDKVVIISTFHEFTYVHEMIDDIAKKLKPKGRVIIIDTFCGMAGHVNRKREEVVAIMQEHGFTLLKMQGTDKNNSIDLYEAVFEKAD